MKTVKHVNPYREGSQYFDGFAYIQKNQVVTRSNLVSFLQKKFDLSDASAMATATVLLSPREKSGRGDCRGNLSSKGEAYFMQPLKKIKGDEKKFRLRWRVKQLSKRDYVRPSTLAKAKEVKQEKTETKAVKAPAKTAEPVTA